MIEASYTSVQFSFTLVDKFEVQQFVTRIIGRLEILDLLLT
jgi:hypothetical protein